MESRGHVKLKQITELLAQLQEEHEKEISGLNSDILRQKELLRLRGLPEASTVANLDDESSWPVVRDVSGASAEAGDTKLKCECGNVFLNDARFCRKCGTARPDACVFCNNILKKDALFCRKCGTERSKALDPVIRASQAERRDSRLSGGDSQNFSDGRSRASFESRSSGMSLSADGIVLDAADSRDVFELKGNWSKAPVASGSNTLVLEVDQAVTKSQANEMSEIIKENTTDTEFRDGAPHSSALRKSVREFTRRIPSHYIVDPSTPKRIAWDLSGMFLIGYDMIAIPIQISFSPEPVPFTVFMGWLTLLFWTSDMITSVFTGYYLRGKLIMDQQKIIMNYLKGWFWVDCIVVIPDWVMKFMGSVTNIAGLGRILRAARIMRVLRLLRLLKLKRLFNIVYDVIDSEATFIIFNLTKLLFMIIFMNHVVACGWYLVGKLTKDAGAPYNWLQDIGMTPVWGESFIWKYLTSMHWSITQFTPASMDVYATNVAERAYSVLILFWALVALSSIIGSVTAAMTALRNMSADENKNMWMLRRYLKQRNIPRTLTDRIIKYLEHQQLKTHNVILPGQVKLLSALSPQFQEELAHELNSPFLREHPFFQYMGNDNMTKKTLYRVCKATLTVAPCAQNETLFNPGDEGLQMYFVKSGNFEYTLVDSADGTSVAVHLGQKLWAGEACLWTTWRHRGAMRALSPSEALGLNPGKFSEVFHLHPKPWYMARNYGIAFVKYMNEVELCALTDVMFDARVWREVVQESDTFVLARRSMMTGPMMTEVPDMLCSRSILLHRATVDIPDSP